MEHMVLVSADDIAPIINSMKASLLEIKQSKEI